jgi:hypothetical protein
MAKVRMKTTLAGPGRAASPGQIIDVPADEAQQLVGGGYAEAVTEAGEIEPAVETADDKRPAGAEKAVAPKGKRGKGAAAGT